MATLLPPPKRIKVYHGIPEPEQPLPDPSPSIVVQFVAEDDGRSLAPSVQLPANVSREDLELLVNKLTGEVRLRLGVWHHPCTDITSRRIQFLLHFISIFLSRKMVHQHLHA